MANCCIVIQREISSFETTSIVTAFIHTAPPYFPGVLTTAWIRTTLEVRIKEAQRHGVAIARRRWG
jgi:hypothetical protein